MERTLKSYSCGKQLVSDSPKGLHLIYWQLIVMADAEIEAAQPAPAPEGVEEEEDEVFLDTTMFDEDDEWLEGALAAPEDEDDDPYYFVQARRTGRLPSLKLIIDPCCC